MFGFIRLAVVGFLVLSVVYFIVRIYLRSVHREELEKDWEQAGRPGERHDYVEKGLQEYEGSLQRKLILLVYVVPAVLVLALIYITNFM